MKKNKRIQSKKEYKDIHCECVICGETDRDVLEVHRIVEGENGGVYSQHNSIVLCSSCHSKVHAGQYSIKGKFDATCVEVLVYINNKTGEEITKKT